jgi:PAS domain-containing protein
MVPSVSEGADGRRSSSFGPLPDIEHRLYPARPSPTTADKVAGLPTQSGQQRAQAIAAEPGPRFGRGSLDANALGARRGRSGSWPHEGDSTKRTRDGVVAKSFDIQKCAGRRSSSLPSASLYSFLDLPSEALDSEKPAGLFALPPGALPQEPVGTRTLPEAVGIATIPEPVSGHTPPGQFPGEADKNLPQGAPVLADEGDRIAKLCSLGVLDTDVDPRFDDITRLVCTIFRAPIALVSLVEKERQWFKSVVGLKVTETARSMSFCAWTLIPVNPEVLVVEDATLDPRFRDNPLVTGPPHIRFYAGAPLVTAEGYRLGSLCVIDREPRRFDAESCNLLCNFAEMVVREIEKEKMRVSESVKLQSQTSSLMRAMDAFNEAIMLVDMELETWTIMFTNDAWLRFMNLTRDRAVGSDLWTIFQQPDRRREATMQAVRKMIDAKQEFALELSFPDARATAGLQRVMVKFRPAATETLADGMPAIGIPGFVPWQNKMPNYFFATVSLKATSSLDRMLDDVMLNGALSGALGSSGSTSSTRGSGGLRWRPQVIAGRREPFEDVQLGPLLGKGSYGRVYRAMWNGAPVAVKVIETPCDKGPDDEPVAMFEADKGAGLSHPNIVQTFKSSSSISKTEGKAYQETWLLLEFCDRGSLQDAMDRGAFRAVRLGASESKADLEAIIATAREVAAGMAYLHADSILHGDLTAGNILLVSSPRDRRQFSAKIADFGLSRVMVETSVSTGSYGTVTHMPPELLTTGRLSRSADTYAFGVLLWEMYSGQRPWAGMLQMQIIFNITVQKKQLEFPADTPANFKCLAARCMSSEPAERPTFVEILDILREEFPAASATM